MVPLEGEIECVTGQGDIIARFARLPKMGAQVMDKRKKHLGEVTWIFGPAEDPYVEIKTNSDPGKRLSILNKDIYAEEI